MSFHSVRMDERSTTELSIASTVDHVQEYIARLFAPAGGIRARVYRRPRYQTEHAAASANEAFCPKIVHAGRIRARVPRL